MSTLKVNSIEGATGGEVDINATLGSIPSLVITGVTTVSAGTTSAPAITPSGDSNTGIFFPSADTIAFAEGGVEAARFDSSGRLGIGTNNPTTEFEVLGSGTVASFRGTGGSSFIGIKDEDDGTLAFIGVDGGTLKFQTSGSGYSDKLVIDTSGRLGIGTTNPQYETHLYGNKSGDVAFVVSNKLSGTTNARTFIALENEVGAQGSIAFGSTAYTMSGNGVFRPSGMTVYTSSANSSGGIAIAARNTAGYIDFYTGGNNPRAIIDASGNVGVGTTGPTAKLEVNGNSIFNGSFTLRSNNTVRGYFGDVDSDTNIQVRAENALTFKAGGNTERARFNTTGAFVLAGGTTTADGIGIAFPATQSASTNANTLDDYEEGTFTPTITGSTTAGTASYTRQLGYYTKVGNCVNFWADVIYSSGTGTGLLQISGLPFTSSSANMLKMVSIYPNDIALTANNVATASISVSVTSVLVGQYPVGGGTATSVSYDAAGQITVSGSYFV